MPVPQLPLHPLLLAFPRCGEVSERLSEYLDGELDETSARRIALHLALCAPCGRFAAELAATIRALHALRR